MTENYIIYDVVRCGYLKRQDNKKIKDILHIVTVHHVYWCPEAQLS